MNRRNLTGMALIALSACSSPQPTQDACVVATVSGFVGAGRAEEHITVAQNGSPCMIFASIAEHAMGEGTIATPPGSWHSHGTAHGGSDADHLHPRTVVCRLGSVRGGSRAELHDIGAR